MEPCAYYSDALTTGPAAEVTAKRESSTDLIHLPGRLHAYSLQIEILCGGGWG